MKANVREFDRNIKTNFLGDEIPKENTHYICIACVTIDSVMKMNKKKSSAGLFRRSSKHRPGPSVCLIHSNPQKFYTGRFYLRLRDDRICEESASRRI